MDRDLATERDCRGVKVSMVRVEVLRKSWRQRRASMEPAQVTRPRRVDFVEASFSPPSSSDVARKNAVVVLGGKRKKGILEELGTNGRPNVGESRLVPGKSSDTGPLTSSLHFEWTNVSQRNVGCGLQNLGNSCYMNAVLQCLTHTPSLAQWCLEGRHSLMKCSSAARGSFCALCAFENHVSMAMKATKRSISPLAFARGLRQLSRGFRLGRQEDAHEFARCLTEAMAKASKVRGPSKANAIDAIFGGRLRSQVKCLACSHCSDTFDPCLDISLDIQRAGSIEKAFVRFTAPDYLDGDNRYKCAGCGKRTCATKRFTVDIAPRVLVLHLKRFSWAGAMGSGKIEKWVEYPTMFDIGSFMSNSNKKCVYHLFAVLVHSGRSTHSGHYYAFIRGPNGMWYEMDDCSVRQVSESTVLKQKAYMLFYNQIVKEPQIKVSNASGKRKNSETTNHGLVSTGLAMNSLIVAENGSRDPEVISANGNRAKEATQKPEVLRNGIVPDIHASTEIVGMKTSPSTNHPSNGGREHAIASSNAIDENDMPKKKGKESLLSRLRPITVNCKPKSPLAARKVYVMRAALQKLSCKKQSAFSSAEKARIQTRGMEAERDTFVERHLPPPKHPKDPPIEVPTSTELCALLAPKVDTWETVDQDTIRKAEEIVAASVAEKKERDWWDIEYDRGKTKKVRRKPDPRPQDVGDHPTNPFQEILSERSRRRRGGDEGKGKASKRSEAVRRAPPKKKRRQ